MLELLIEWIIGVVSTLPVAAGQNIIISIFINIFKYVYYSFKHIEFDTIKFRKPNRNNGDDKKYYFIESPKIIYQETKTSTIVIKTQSNSSEDNIFLYLILSIAISSTVSAFFIKYIDIISNILKISSIIPIYLCIFLLAKILFTNTVQKITIKYIIYTLVVSSLTLYYGTNLVELSREMTSSTEDLKLLGESIQIIFGVGLAVCQQILSYIMLFRVILVFIYSKKSKESKTLKKFLFKTQFFEKIPFLVGFIVLISGFSIYFTRILFS